MRKHRFMIYSALLAAFACIVLILLSIYALKLRDVLEENLLADMHEIAMHDKRAIETNIDFFLEQLQSIDKRLTRANCRNIKEAQSILDLEAATSAFKDLYLLGADGRIYAGTPNDIRSLDERQGRGASLGQLFSNSQTEYAVTLYKGPEEISGITDGSIIYGIRLKDFIINGERMEALFGVTDTTFLQEHLLVENFMINGEPNGYSAVLDRNGDMIAGPKKGGVFFTANTFLAIANEGSFGMPIAQIKEKMRSAQTFSLHYTGPQGDRLIYLTPLNAEGDATLDWYLGISISNAMIENRQWRLELLAFGLLGVVLLSLVALTTFVITARHRIFQATEAVKIRSEFLSNMSHEIRTPLNGLIGLNYLISTHIDEPESLPQIKLWLAKAKNLSTYLMAILNDILDVSSLQSGKFAIKEAPVSLDALLDDICFMQSGNAETRGVKIKLEKSLEYPWVYGDEVRIKQILANIVSNAIKFTPKGGVVTLSVRQKAFTDGRIETVFACTDTGKGMRPEFLKHIFDPFAQEKQVEPDLSLRGTGIGLTISRALAQALGGDIDVKSTLGKGSTFSVRIPGKLAVGQTEEDEEEAKKARLARESAAADGNRTKALNVLLVEDDEFNADFLMELLQEDGFNAVHAENGKEALEIFEKSAPFEFDVILMDMQMPVMDGCEATAAIRRLNRPDADSVWVYACTANTFRQDMDRAMASGMNEFLAKPIDIKIFLQKLNSRERLKQEKNAVGEPEAPVSQEHANR